jgi:hypothetical protein
MNQTLAPSRLAVAGRYLDRHATQAFLDSVPFAQHGFAITASWLTQPEASDSDLNDAQAIERAELNILEITKADALLYFPKWVEARLDGTDSWPLWSPGRLIDVGLAMALCVPIVVVGKVEPSIYFRNGLVTVCEAQPDALLGCIHRVLVKGRN